MQQELERTQKHAQRSLSKEDWIRFYQVAFAISRRMGETSEDAKENAHEALIRFLKTDLSHVNDKESYFRKIAINIVNEKYRQIASRQTSTLDDYEEELATIDGEHRLFPINYAILAQELYSFIIKSPLRSELFKFLFEKFVLYRPALNNALKEDDGNYLMRGVDRGKSKLQNWVVPQWLSAPLAELVDFLNQNSINPHSILEILQSSKFVLLNSGLASMVATICEGFIRKIIKTVQHLRIGLILNSEARTHNEKITMQHAFWSVSQLVYNLSAIDQLFYVMGSMQYLRKKLQRQTTRKCTANPSDLSDAWQVTAICLEKNVFRHPAEEWIAIELLGLLPEYIDVPVDSFERQIFRVLAKVKNQRSLPRVGAAWACANVSKISKYSPLGQVAMQSTDLGSWPGGEAAHPIILLTPHLSNSMAKLQHTMQFSPLWDLLLRTLSSCSDVAKLGALSVLAPYLLPFISTFVAFNMLAWFTKNTECNYPE